LLEERLLRHRYAVTEVVERARRLRVSPWEVPEKVIEAAILLDDDDDVLDLPSATAAAAVFVW